MEDVVSLNFIKRIFGPKSILSDGEAVEYLAKIEKRIVNFYNNKGPNGKDYLMKTPLVDLVELIKEDNVFKKSSMNFVKQHKLQIHKEAYITLPYIIAFVIRNMLGEGRWVKYDKK